ncbi:hypothetical protein E2562_029275 [Oryza meyeriana var. granulata]|uniref:Uncharacterized protein n=1 Tax=Oryza meyeriana var. granulata TaxID=110450 RepID=A0A6G1BP86_9ORYZ|nr:hypothetical protein E2562_029275 [Oryza meyeriana var. granulata]
MWLAFKDEFITNKETCAPTRMPQRMTFPHAPLPSPPDPIASRNHTLPCRPRAVNLADTHMPH